jgi:peptidoglycan/LPS O-acetylase OafA/YrhL
MLGSEMPFRLGHRPELDGLRGLAVLAVMLGHCSALGAGADLSALGRDPGVPPLGLLHGGVFGVDMFYVLSGFLITSLLLQERAESGMTALRNFYIRRFLRLMPALFILLVACSIYIAATDSSRGDFGARAVVLSALYSANFARGFHVNMGMLTHTWSLALEEQFYFIWPVSLLFLLHFRHRTILIGIICGACFAAILRYIAWSLHAHYFAWGQLPTRADALLSGIAVALMAHWNMLENSSLRRLMPAVAYTSATLLIAMLVFVDGGSPIVFRGFYFLAAVVTASLIASLVTAAPRPLARLLSFGPLAYTGKISYGLYLYHFPIFCLLPFHSFSLITQKFPLAAAVCGVFALTFGVATISYFLVEKNALMLKKYFSSHPSTAPALHPHIAGGISA